MKKLLILLCLLLAPSSAYAQKTKSALTTEVGTNLASGTAITASTLRTTLIDMINSWYDLNGSSSAACSTHQWVSGFPTLSSQTCTQPSFSDLSGVAAPAQLPTATASAQGALPAWPGTTTSYFRGDGSYQPLNFAALGGTAAVAQGGTGGGTASGTLLDNITGFSSTGFLNRTGAGAYSFVAATNANTASTLVQRDSSGNFSAGTITGSLTGHSSLDLALAGGTMTGVLASTNATASANGGSTGAITTLGGISAAGEIYGLRVNAYGAGGVSSNLAFGNGSLASNTSGAGNIAIGYVALNVNLTGINNVAIGAQTLQNVTSNSNTGVGAGAGQAIASGSGNTIIGSSSGTGIISGASNTIVGVSSATTLTGSNNTIIGANVTVSAAGNANTVVIADGSGTIRFDYGNTTANTNTITGPAAFTSALIAKGSSPVGTTGSCSASSFVGGAMAGKFTAPTCSAGTIILSSLPTAPNGYTCEAQDQTTPADTLKQTANSATSATFTSTTVSGDAVVFKCMAW